MQKLEQIYEGKAKKVFARRSIFARYFLTFKADCGKEDKENEI